MIDEPLTPDSPSVDAAAGVEDSEPEPMAFPPPGPPVLVSEIGLALSASVARPAQLGKRSTAPAVDGVTPRDTAAVTPTMTAVAAASAIAH